MTSYRAAAGSGEDWLSACDDCLTALGELSPDANLGIVYVSSSLAHALDLIAARLKDATGIDAWVGCEYHPFDDTFKGLAWREQLERESLDV